MQISAGLRAGDESACRKEAGMPLTSPIRGGACRKVGGGVLLIKPNSCQFETT